ncbi:hypothetical protein [Vulcanisaeta sp. JCM 16159]|uniref:hypothetical protein n=1 Tax=Vulcanisaeta sp. JCM 16159 TaxID=1295371 RepID=UPI000A90C443|nr:hypothetical protein [Vulcanisaeta sp. JCM 16159]
MGGLKPFRIILFSIIIVGVLLQSISMILGIFVIVLIILIGLNITRYIMDKPTP